jgi:hypothetical protein
MGYPPPGAGRLSPRRDSPHAVPTRHPSPLSPCDTGVGWAWKSPPPPVSLEIPPPPVSLEIPPPYRWKSPP